MLFDFPVIDLHTHLRNDLARHTQIAKESGIDVVVYMGNSEPPLDNLVWIRNSLKRKRYCVALPVSAITKNLAGKVLVDVEKIKPYVVGFSDDGRYFADFDLLAQILKKRVLVLAHCCPPYILAKRRPDLERVYIQKYIQVLERVSGRLHIQHVSTRQSVDTIRRAKERGLQFTCETCPHYFTYTKEDLETKVNPPLRTERDVLAILGGLADGTIDVIASDYAPLPRQTGIAGFRSFLPLAYGLVLRKVLTLQQLKEKVFLNPLKIIQSGGYQGSILPRLK